MISNVTIHLLNDLPIVVDLEALPEGSDRNVRCTNVRTVDGKRPSFVHDRNSTFVFPLAVIRLIEVPTQEAAGPGQVDGEAPVAEHMRAAMLDEEPDEDLLARIRSA